MQIAAVVAGDNGQAITAMCLSVDDGSHYRRGDDS